MFVDGRYTLQAAKQVDAKAWSIEPLVDPPPENWLARHLAAGDRLGFDPWLHTSAAAERLACGLRQGRRRAGRGRQQSARFGVDRAPAAAARPGHRSRHAIFRRGRGRKAQPDPARNRPPRRRCAGAVGFARGGLDLQHPRRRRLAYAAAAVLCAGAEGRPPHHVHRSPQAFQQRPRPSRTARRCRRSRRRWRQA